MAHRTPTRLIVLVGPALLLAGQAWAGTLYDPALASLPSAQGWTTSSIGPFAQSVAGGVYNFGTLASDAVRAGSARAGVPGLDTSTGFTLDFDLRVLSEAHARPERGGFSFIVTGADTAHALEIAFWTDHVWVYTNSFAHGADAAFDTTQATHYALTVANQGYALSADGVSLFSGALADYSAFGAPYNVASFIFFGDDTGSARAQVELGRVSLTPVPEPATTALLIGGLLSLALWQRRCATTVKRSE